MKQRLFIAACWLFGVPLPGRQPEAVGRPVARFIIILLLGAVIGCLIICSAGAVQDFVNGWNAGFHAGSPLPPEVKWNIPLSVLIGASLVALLFAQSRIMKSAILLTGDRLNLELERASRQQLEAELRLMKAQIEPHFLFNTLGAVQQLAEDKAPQAAMLTAELITFLRATMASLRADTIRLADDSAVCAAYLRIMQVRLGARLAFSVNCPPALADFQLPTTLLLTLVENAIQHGIERTPAGGRLDITAARQEDRVVIAVADTGAGFGVTVGQGVGLQHIRDRLALVYGGDARLTIEENMPNGVIARLYLPQ